MTPSPTRAIAMISGRGSNLQAILDAITEKNLYLDICAVVTNRCNALGLTLAKKKSISTHCVDNKDYADRESYDRALLATMEPYHAELIIMAGFIRILTPAFIQHYRGKILNIHPSLLPKYRGLNTHQRALDNRESEHGASVHFVTAELDGGPVIIQSRVPVLNNDSADSLSKRILQQEHKIYPLAIKWFTQGRLKMIGSCAYLDGKALQKPYEFNETIA